MVASVFAAAALTASAFLVGRWKMSTIAGLVFLLFVLNATALTAVDRSIHLFGGAGTVAVTGGSLVLVAFIVAFNRRHQPTPT